MTLKELSSLIDICKTNNITSVKFGDVELYFGPPLGVPMTPTEQPYKEPTQEELLMQHVGGEAGFTKLEE